MNEIVPMFRAASHCPQPDPGQRPVSESRYPLSIYEKCLLAVVGAFLYWPRPRGFRARRRLGSRHNFAIGTFGDVADDAAGRGGPYRRSPVRFRDCWRLIFYHLAAQICRERPSRLEGGVST